MRRQEQRPKKREFGLKIQILWFKIEFHYSVVGT